VSIGGCGLLLIWGLGLCELGASVGRVDGVDGRSVQDVNRW